MYQIIIEIQNYLDHNDYASAEKTLNEHTELTEFWSNYFSYKIHHIGIQDSAVSDIITQLQKVGQDPTERLVVTLLELNHLQYTTEFSKFLEITSIKFHEFANLNDNSELFLYYFQELKLHLAKLYQFLSHHEKTLELLEPGFGVLERNGRLQLLAFFNSHVGYSYRYLFDFKIGLEYLKKAEDYFKLTNQHNYYLTVRNTIGDLIMYDGRLEEAKDVYLENILIGLTNSLYLHVATGLIYIGYVLQLMGKIENAIEIHKDGIALSKRNNLSIPMNLGYHLLARDYYYRGDYETAIYYYKKTNTEGLFKEFYLVNIFFLGRSYLELGEYDTVRQYIEMVKSDQDLTEFQEMLVKTLETRYYASLPRALYKAKSQEELKKYIEIDNNDYELRLEQLCVLSNLLLDELQQYHELEVLQELNETLQIILNLTRTTRSFTNKLEYDLLKARLLGVTGDYSKAMEKIESVISVSDKFSIGLVKDRACQLKKELTNQFENWQTVINQNYEFSKELKDSKISEFLDYILAL